MIVYAQRKRRVKTKTLESLADPLDALIESGEVEAALADAGHRAADRLRAHTLRAARAYWHGLTHWERFDASGLPEEVEVSVPEGYAYYALLPRTYGDAALRFHDEARPERVVVIGIRSIGTSLSAVAAAALENRVPVRSFTVRPDGHPFNRRLALDIDDRGEHYLIVDEGPGLSGSTFASVARALRAGGVPDSRIAFLPSWDADGSSFCSEGACAEWTRHRRFPPRDSSVPPGEDVSAGQWRRLFFDDACKPATHPHHERRKFLDDGQLWKFAGFGKYGREKWDRACILHDAGFTPKPLALVNGYLLSEFVPGCPVDRRGVDGALAFRIREYTQFVEREFAQDGSVRVGEIEEMVRINAGETAADLLRRLSLEIANQRTCAIDGRQLAHEWIRTARGYVKADSLDHHDDHFFPGCQHADWDRAAANQELGLQEPCSLFYRLAYLSYRLGYCILAGEADQGRFRHLARRYRAALEEIAQSCC